LFDAVLEWSLTLVDSRSTGAPTECPRLHRLLISRPRIGKEMSFLVPRCRVFLDARPPRPPVDTDPDHVDVDRSETLPHQEPHYHGDLGICCCRPSSSPNTPAAPQREPVPST